MPLKAVKIYPEPANLVYNIRGAELLTVEYVLNLSTHGATVKEILEEYEGLTQEDIRACFLFATKSLESTTFMRA